MLAELIKDYVDKAIEYEFVSRDRDEYGYTCSGYLEQKAKEEAYDNLKYELAKHKRFINL